MKPQLTINKGDDPNAVKEMLEQHGKVLVNISLGDGTGSSEDQNVDAYFVTGTFPVANTDVTIAHKLGRVPVGYIVVKLSVATIIYDGSIVATDSAITLKSNTAGAVAKILLF
jgi:hypothetical protein